MADEVTGLERQEQKADNAVFGASSGLDGGNNTLLLERSDTNKVTAGSSQSELRMAWLWLYHYLNTRDNMIDKDGIGINDHKKHYREEDDPDGQRLGRKIRIYFPIPYWDWLLFVVDDKVITHQLTLWGYSRLQFMDHSAAVVSLNQNKEQNQGGLLTEVQRLLKG